MRYLLDTNVWINYLKDPDSEVRKRLFTVDTAFYASLRHDLEIRGEVIGPYDLQIAAISLRQQLTLVTSNVTEFTRVKGLTVQDWS